jgi:putative DNA primase/helicase
MEYKISVVTNLFDNRPNDITLTYDELVSKLTNFPDKITPKFENQGFVAGHFGQKQRLTENLISRSLITLDLDHYDNDLTSLEGVLKRDLHDQWYIAYSTASHSPEKPKIRIVILLTKDIPVASYRTVVINFVDGLELTPFLDKGKASEKPNQFMFFPAKACEDYKPWSFVNVGELLNPDYYLVDDGMSNITEMPLNSFNGKAKKKIVDKDIDNVLTTLRNQPLNITAKQIKDTLKVYKAEATNYHTWIEVGMALAHQFKGETEGLQIWYDWSKLDSRYDKKKIYNEVKAKWISFNESPNPIRFSTIMKKTQENKVVSFNSKVAVNDSQKSIAYNNIPRHKFIHTTGDNLKPLNTIENFKVLLNEYDIKIENDVILKRKEVTFGGVLENDLNTAQTRMESLCIQNGMSSISAVKYIDACRQEVNSWKNWIESKAWDGKDRLNDLYSTVSVDQEHQDTKDAYLKAWFMQMIHLSCLNDDENGKMGRLVLVFQGDQRVGKTSWFKALCPSSHQRYLQEGIMLDTKDSMSVLGCIQNVFVELGELGSTFRKSDSDNLKNFISSTTDLIDVKYVANHVSYRRRTVFFASINDQIFLQDATGNTRYLILPVIKCDYSHNVDMQQLYAQLYQMAKDGEGYEINGNLLIEQQNLNSEFENESYLEGKFCDIFNTELESRDLLMNIPAILESLGFTPSSIKQSHMTEMSRILKKLGYKKRTNKPKHWLLPPKK